ncbi:MAG: POTRA domain-containing protein, partial [Bacteroidales bacterium]
MYRIVFIIVFSLLPVALLSQCENFFVNEIIISGNNKTKSEIILREAPFNAGSNISDFEIDEFKNNLQRTGLFNFVFIDTLINRDCSIVINVKLIEKWYYWIYPIFEHADRNFPAFLKNQDWNKINYGISVELKNFTGNNDLLKLKLRFGFKEHFSIAYSSKEFFDNKVFSVKSGIDFFRQKRFEQKIFSNLPVFVSSDTDYIKTSLEPYLLLT